MVITCDAGYNIIETAIMVLVSLLVNGLAAVIIVQYLLRLIYENVRDVSLIPLPHREKRTPPKGFTPVDPDKWAGKIGGGVVGSDDTEFGELVCDCVGIVFCNEDGKCADCGGVYHG